VNVVCLFIYLLVYNKNKEKMKCTQANRYGQTNPYGQQMSNGGLQFSFHLREFNLYG
jgi:hypothetical protein